MTKVVWLPNETDYSYCEFVAPNTPYCIFQKKNFKSNNGAKYMYVLQNLGDIIMDIYIENIMAVAYPQDRNDRNC